jgi:hypothetical protein
MDYEDGSQSYFPEETETRRQSASLVEVLTGAHKILQVLRHEFRGEELVQTKEGENIWFQVSKPLFVRTNTETEEAIKEKVKDPYGQIVEVYIPHDEAIEEILSAIKMCGLNQITPLGTTDNQEMSLDLHEFEKVLSYLLTLKRKEWGIEKSLRSMVYKKIKQQVQDARTMQKDGRVLKAISQTVKRIESAQIGEKKQRTPYE